MARNHTPILGLVGGVGCGKSAVAAWLADHLRALVVDADAVGHAVLHQDSVKAQLVDAFGEEILEDGQIRRSAIAAQVFGTTRDHRAARDELERIVHPVMRIEFEETFRQARRNGDIDLIVFDAAILLESGWRDAVDVVAFLDVPFSERLRRVTASRGWTEQDLRRREASQWPLDRKRAAADVVIDNSADVASAGRQLESYLHSHGHLPSAAPTEVATTPLTH